MIDPRLLDVSAFGTPARLSDRLRSLAGSPRAVMGSTLGVLLLVTPVVVLIALVTTDNANDVGGLAVLGMCFAGGVWVMVDVMRLSAASDVLGRFAAANRLQVRRSTLAPELAGSLFADRSHVVDESVRTDTSAQVEIGNRFPVQGRVDRRARRSTAGFLRARLVGGAVRAPGGGPVISPVITDGQSAELDRLLGRWRVEMTGDEMTVFGERPLDLADSGEVVGALEVITDLARASSHEPPPLTRPATTTVTGPTSSHGGRSPWAVVGVTLLLLVVGPLAIAVVMSVLDDVLPRDRGTARLVVGAVVAVTLVVVGWVVRRMITAHRD